jgi:Uma2 family endonuclease
LVVLRENDAILCDDSIHGAPDLVVEVLSPGTARYDLVGKRAAYERYGVREYWVVDVKARTLLQLVLAEGRYRETLHAADAVFRPAILPELEVRLAEVWPLPR